MLDTRSELFLWPPLRTPPARDHRPDMPHFSLETFFTKIFQGSFSLASLHLASFHPLEIRS